MTDPGTHPAAVELVRRYYQDFINAHDVSAVDDLIADDYRIHIAGNVVTPSDYRVAAAALFTQFPELHVGVHEILTDGERVAVRLMAQGASRRYEGNRAAWGGVGIYSSDGARLTECWIEEDHHRARTQLRTGTFEPPGDTPAEPFAEFRAGDPGPGVTEVAESWLRSGADGALGTSGRIDALLVVADRFAFHATGPATHVAGMATVTADRGVSEIHTFTDGGTTRPPAASTES